VLIIIAVLGFALLGLHIWFIHNARGYLKEMIATKSHGKLKLELAEVSFDFFFQQDKNP